MQYEIKLREIEKTDFTKKINQSDEVLAHTAEYIGLTLEEYKKKLAQEMKASEITKLKEKFGFLTEDEKKDIEEKKKKIEMHINDFVKKFERS